MQGVALFYPFMSRQELLHVFPQHCEVTKILTLAPISDEEKIRKIEALLRDKSHDPVYIFQIIFTSEGVSLEVRAYFIKNYKQAFLAFIHDGLAEEIIQLPYLDDNWKIACLEQKKLSKKDFYLLWNSVIQARNVTLAQWLLCARKHFKFTKFNEAHRALMKQYVNSHGKHSPAFVNILLDSPLIDPKPIIPFFNETNNFAGMQKVRTHALYEK